ncbi:MAG: hypothetical protein AVDCRST_MAG77-2496 [uncultured Chloroflexi bacterium]|uniref:DAGKc domain-containing protein n=1 Tax=uncultured Chloroflexota bacterium TaxID=166587 RepID=A0A6J4IT05_9CHLR|nr:MAG: hypothetical protein AVDCRST_MAG77-2496 [uncultured Chloroflexota bacterium]
MQYERAAGAAGPPAGTQRLALLVIKPVPVPELGGDPVPHIVRRLAAAGIECRVATTQPNQPAAALVREALACGPPPDLVVAAGGDGTHGPVAAALAEASAGATSHGDSDAGPAENTQPGARTVPLALIPLGTFNNFARSLGIPRQIDAALDVIAAGHSRAVDAGRVNGRLFFEVAGAGWDATLFPAGESLKRGNVAGMLTAVRSIFRFQAGEIVLLLDGARRVASRTPTVVVANGPYFGSSFAVAPTSRLDDGLLTVTLFEGFGKADLLAYFASVAEGHARPDPRVVSHRAARVEVLSPPTLPAHADGEPIGSLATAFEAVPRALTIFTPLPQPPSAALRSTARWSIAQPTGSREAQGATPSGPVTPEAEGIAGDAVTTGTPRPGSQTMRWKVPPRPAPDADAERTDR